MSQSEPLPAGDILFLTEDLDTGSSAHHVSSWAASAFRYCIMTKTVNLPREHERIENVHLLSKSEPD